MTTRQTDERQRKYGININCQYSYYDDQGEDKEDNNDEDAVYDVAVYEIDKHNNESNEGECDDEVFT